MVAIHIQRTAQLRRLRIDDQLVRQHRLGGVVTGLHVGHMLRVLHRRLVAIERVVGNLQQHQVPTLWLVSPEWVK